jgi:transcriptional regulator with XRE-family HTH domain
MGMELWIRLENELKRCGENWRWLGKMSSVPESTLSRWRDNGKYPSVEKVIKMAQAVGRSVEYLVTGLEQKYSDISEVALTIARAADRLDETGKVEALHLVQSLEKLHPLSSTEAGGSSRTAT